MAQLVEDGELVCGKLLGGRDIIPELRTSPEGERELTTTPHHIKTSEISLFKATGRNSISLWEQAVSRCVSVLPRSTERDSSQSVSQ